MSWDAYVDSIIGNSKGSCSKACLIGQDGAIWTPVNSANGSKVFPISQAEASTIGPVMKKKDGSVKDYFSQNGVTINGTRYMFLRDLYDDGRAMVAKKTGEGSITLQTSKTAVLIAFTPDGQQQGNTTPAVDSIAKYLEGTGY